MKALLTAFALLSFVAATTVPYVAQAATATTDQTAPKKKTTKKKTVKKTSAKKTSKKKTTKKPASAPTA
ncbi:MAG: hypothetical protein JO255_12625 [Alphaproteobacteria bacterium]|nr:hypothetical protein [Alphaproteobacteria bacterium]